MTQVNSLQEASAAIVERYETNEKARRPLRNFFKSIRITCGNPGQVLLIRIHGDKGIEIADHPREEKAPIEILFTDEQVLFDLLNLDLDGAKGYATGRIKVKRGKMGDLMRLRRLLF